MAESSTYWIQDSAAGRLRKASRAGVSPAFDGLAPAGTMPALPSRFGIEVQHKGHEANTGPCLPSRISDIVFFPVSGTLSSVV
jgi:hypothetical protein